eukprot:CAMPEP_0168329372 /NCGR_PEP_ID=MMETSP0213-20121227/7072_1 /TAXON_ID=151035 /ORGANISM="Euplotes harpa, Strain FSP1.4" /LENGTH=482 /DNA_ID=CAMNT_0008332691 /DNA_START=1 /DNA_END=1445 /DNA_ORIENTATION=-
MEESKSSETTPTSVPLEDTKINPDSKQDCSASSAAASKAESTTARPTTGSSETRARACSTASAAACPSADRKEVLNLLKLLKRMIRDAIAYSKAYEVDKEVTGLDVALHAFAEKLRELKKKADDILNQDLIVKFYPLRKEMLILIDEFKNSYKFQELAVYRMARGISDLKVAVTSKITVKDPEDEDKLKVFKEIIANDLIAKKNKEIEEKTKEISDKLVEENKDRLKSLSDQLEEEKSKSQRLSENNDKIEEEFKISVTELEEMKEAVKKYNTNESIEFKADMTKDSDKSVVDALVKYKIKMAKASKLIINKISDNDEKLNSFIKYCCPDDTEHFVLNHSYINKNVCNIAYYLDSLARVLKGVTKEVYLVNLEVKEQDLQTIIKSSAASERVTIRYSNVHCSSALDFSSDTKYKTMYLSFCNSGHSDRPSDWLSKRSLFEHIITGVATSGLRDSLQTLNIYGCELETGEVEGMLAKHGLTGV